MVLDKLLIFAKILFPLIGGTFSPNFKSLFFMLFKFFHSAIVSLAKMSYDFFIVNASMICKYSSQTNMFNMMAHLTKKNETFKFLYMVLIIILPYLM